MTLQRYKCQAVTLDHTLICRPQTAQRTGDLLKVKDLRAWIKQRKKTNTALETLCELLALLEAGK